MQLISSINGQRGAVAIMVALLLFSLIGIAALAVDVGHLMIARNELQNIADSAALAATRKLGVNYANLSYTEQQTYQCDPGEIISVVRDVASKNQVAGGSINILDSDVTIGTWDSKRKKLTPTNDHPDAVRVAARKGGDIPVTTFFARIFGIPSVPVIDIDATAALIPGSVISPGNLLLPIGISEHVFDYPDIHGKEIDMFPLHSENSYIGAHTYDENPPKTDTLIEILTGLKNGTYKSPEVKAGETIFQFFEDGVSGARLEMIELFKIMRGKNEEPFDGDKDPDTWTMSVVVYDDDEPNQHPVGQRTIVGFSTITITGVNMSGGGSEVGLKGIIKCDMIKDQTERGGSTATIGSKSSLPGLVE